MQKGDILGHEFMGGREATPEPAPVVRVAQLVRSSALRQCERGGSIVVEALDARLRITIEVGAERDIVAAVLGVLVPEAR